MKGVCVSSPRFLGELSGPGLGLAFWFSYVTRLLFGLARGPSLFWDPSLVLQMPGHVVEVSCVWHGYLKFRFGFETIPMRLLGRIWVHRSADAGASGGTAGLFSYIGFMVCFVSCT